MEQLRKTLPILLLVALLLVSVLSFLRICDLENQVRRLEGGLSTVESSLCNQMSNLVWNVNDALEQKAAILADASYEVGELDPETLTVPVTVTLTPKSQQESSTASLQLDDGRSIELTRSGVSYTATLQLGLTEQLSRPHAVVTTEGLQSVQTLDWYLNPQDYVMPYVDIHYPRTLIIPSYKLEGPIDVYVNGNTAESVSGMQLVTLLDGVEQQRETFSLTEQSEYQTVWTLTPSEREWKLEPDSRLVTWLELEAGELTWVYGVAAVTCREDGELAEADIYRSEPIELRTASGKTISFDWAEQFGY